MELPLVSIVTPSYNMGSYIAQTIESVLAQNYPSIEYLVVDGGSTDGTLDVLHRYEGRVRFITGRDCGPADAINRGFRLTTGTVFTWLNADDFYLPGAVRAAVDQLSSRPHAAAVYGNAYWTDSKARIIGPYPTRDFTPELLLRECFICQPACFMRSEAFASLMLDTRLQYAFDYDLWIRAASRWNFERISQHMACSRMHLENRTLGQRFGMLGECLGVLRQHYGYVPFRWVHTYCSYLLDRTDQFFDPMRPTILKYLLSLPVGCWHNRRSLPRYWAEWRSVMSRQAFLRHLRERPRPVMPSAGPTPSGE